MAKRARDGVTRMLITGAGGRLGSRLARRFGEEPVGLCGLPVARELLDLRDQDAVAARVGGMPLAGVVNCAGATNVSRIEQDPRAYETAWEVNAVGVAGLARACARRNLPLIHISTDFVFSGEERDRFNESSVPRPVSRYGHSKLSGEHAILLEAALRPEWWWAIIRIAGPLYTNRPCFASGLLDQLDAHRRPVPVVSDVTTSVVHDDWLVDELAWLAEHMSEVPAGVYHLASSTAASWLEIARRLGSGLEQESRIVPTDRAAWSRVDPVPRAGGTALDVSLWRAVTGRDVPTWQRMVDSWRLARRDLHD